MVDLNILASYDTKTEADSEVSYTMMCEIVMQLITLHFLGVISKVSFTMALRKLHLGMSVVDCICNTVADN